MPLREPLSLRATDHGIIPQECTNKGRALFNDRIMEKEIFEKLKRVYSQADSVGREIMEREFPELAESEDERIRKWLIKSIHLIGVDRDICADQETMDKAIAWLERQKEQKPVETSDFKTKLAEYLQNNSPKDGQYVISSESILEMAKEELI